MTLPRLASLAAAAATLALASVLPAAAPRPNIIIFLACLLYTSDAADE